MRPAVVQRPSAHVQNAGNALDRIDHFVQMLDIKHFDGHFDVSALVRRDTGARIANAGFHV